jgi:hypothetical protein
MKSDRWIKLVAITALVLSTIALLLAYQSPATGYELSIYDSSGVPIWVFIILAVSGGTFILIHQAIVERNENRRLWLLGLSVIILAQVVILVIPYIRGYEAFRGDNITHLGMVRDITISGHFSNVNFYPSVHILTAWISSVTGIQEAVVFNLGTAFFAPVIFLLSIYMLANMVLPERRQRLIAVALAGLIFPAVYITPNGWSMLFLPLLFLCYFKRTIPDYRIFLVILLVLFPFLHPLSSLILILALIVIELSRAVLALKAREETAFRPSGFTFEPILLEIVVFCAWVLSFSRFYVNLQVFWNQILNFTKSDVLGDIGATLSKIDISGPDLIVLYLKLYGVSTVLIVLSLVTVFLLIRRIRSNWDRGTTNLFLLATTFIFTGFLYLLYLLGFPGLAVLGGDRFLRYAIILTPLLAGFGVYEIIRRLNHQKAAVAATAALTVICAGMVVFTLYSSPFTVKPNAQVTRMDMSGMTWFIEEKDRDIDSIHIMSPVERFADGIIGEVASSERRDLESRLQFPDHFAYDQYDTLGEQYAGDRYAVITRFDRVIYTTVWEVVGRFNVDDFDNLENDPTASKLYSNGELDIYLIHGSKN